MACGRAGITNSVWFLGVLPLLQGQSLGPLSYGLDSPGTHLQAKPFLSQQALLQIAVST